MRNKEVPTRNKSNLELLAAKAWSWGYEDGVTGENPRDLEDPNEPGIIYRAAYNAGRKELLETS